MIARRFWSCLATGAFAFLALGNFAVRADEPTDKNKTVQYEETVKGPPLADGVQLLEKKQVKVLGNHLKREEIDIKYFDKDGKSLSERRQRFYKVFDSQQDKLLIVFPDKHGYAVTDYSSKPIVDDKPGTTFTLVLDTPKNFYDLVHDVPSEKSQKLPDWEINGKVVNGFLVEEKQEMPFGTQTWQRTYWIDPSTKLPVQIEIKMRTAAKQEMKDDKTIALQTADDELRNIVFDAPLDAKLFSLEPPEGYTDMRPQTAQMFKEADKPDGKVPAQNSGK